MDWRVELDVFNGPLDLLLYLIRRDELDIFDIPISRITASYIEYLDVLRTARDAHGIDIDTIGDFIVMAATLMEIKSATLLPTPPAADGDAGASAGDPLVDPRAELIRQLLEYKRFKDHAAVLERQQKTHEQRFPRFPAAREVVGDEPPPLDLDEVQVWDLLGAFAKLMGEIGVRKRVHEVLDDDTPIDLHAADIEDRLTRDGAQTLRQLLSSRRSRSEIVGVFLALLELIREKRIIARFSEMNAEDIAIEIASEEHRKTFRGASLHLGENLDEELADEDLADEQTSIAEDIADGESRDG